MSSKDRDREQYLKEYPVATGRWLNRCPSCGSVGHKPEMPKQVGVGVLAKNLRSHFSPMALGESGLCNQCASSIAERPR